MQRKTISGSFIILVFLLNACTVSTFDKPFPESGKSLKVFPKKMRGSWKPTSFSAELPLAGIVITSDSLFVSFAASNSEKPAAIGLQNDSIRLVKFQNDYTFSLLTEHKWLVYIVKLKPQTGLEIIGFDKRCMQIVKDYDIIEQPSKLTVIHYSPTKKEWDQVLEFGLAPPVIFSRSR